MVPSCLALRGQVLGFYQPRLPLAFIPCLACDLHGFPVEPHKRKPGPVTLRSCHRGMEAYVYDAGGGRLAPYVPDAGKETLELFCSILFVSLRQVNIYLRIITASDQPPKSIVSRSDRPW